MMDGARGFAGVPGWHMVGPNDSPGMPPTPDQTMNDLATLMSEARDLLRGILAELQAQAQKGYVYAESVSVSSTIPVSRIFDPPLFSISITNDGPGTVQYRIPNQSSAVWVDIMPNEQLTFNFIKGLVTGAAFCVRGAAANIRLVGTY